MKINGYEYFKEEGNLTVREHVTSGICSDKTNLQLAISSWNTVPTKLCYVLYSETW